ncbi:NAD-dependent epimerase/dehydratase family protein [Enterovirga rhinocerotis]|uniref:Uronate dehydrogenase n=1 Tax=Enterovirga rhinocerotis TaxID=1339210 RepID=A0A4R7BY22_9HYPH|nr:NAD(P)-dependent oxidoreductase [Enterovirga rhinocerotis]TDR90142.1 uronate dehydrogenase [Enterovirga rhinocerotis]
MTDRHQDASSRPAGAILLTGASGALGRVLARGLAAEGWTLRLTDIVPFPDPVPAGCTFEAADLVDRDAVARLAEGCSAILHFGGTSVEKPFDEVIGPNIAGLYNIYEAARLAKARVVFASSNHTIGFHARSTTIDPDSPLRPDGYYGASKVWGEMMAGLYWRKHAVESVIVRIGSCFPEPVDARMLATWLSYGDLTRLCIRAILAPQVGCCVVWGASNNSRMTWWEGDARDLIGWAPEDSADGFAEALAAKTSDDPVIEAHQGGGYVKIGWTRP